MKKQNTKPLRALGRTLSFAKKIGSSKSAIINVLSATRNDDPSFKMIKSIVSIFPVSEEWLLLGNGNPFTLKDIEEYKYSEQQYEPLLDSEVNARVKAIRYDLGVSQALFADSIGTTRDVVSFIESNRSSVTIPLLKRIVKKHKVNPVWLLFGEGDRNLRR
jgi:transcriptional regulator with XRE-family HTH domain